MKRQFVLIVVLAIVGATAAVGGLISAERGRAAADPPTNIRAVFSFVDDGTTLTVTGTAKGLDPGETYLSNIYDLDSVADGPDACAPAIFDPRDPDFILPTMFLGFWTVDEDGVGKLFATNTNGGADHVPLDKIGTVSVRLVAGPPTMPGGPPETKLVACGSVSESPGIGQSP